MFLENIRVQDNFCNYVGWAVPLDKSFPVLSSSNLIQIRIQNSQDAYIKLHECSICGIYVS